MRLTRWWSRKGAKIAHAKETSNLPFEPLAPPALLYFPVQQHQGAPAVPVVKKGDEVRVGQLLARTDGPDSANVHSSVADKLERIELVMHSVGIQSADNV